MKSTPTIRDEGTTDYYKNEFRVCRSKKLSSDLPGRRGVALYILINERLQIIYLVSCNMKYKLRYPQIDMCSVVLIVKETSGPEAQHAELLSIVV